MYYRHTVETAYRTRIQSSAWTKESWNARALSHWTNYIAPGIKKVVHLELEANPSKWTLIVGSGLDELARLYHSSIGMLKHTCMH